MFASMPMTSSRGVGECGAGAIRNEQGTSGHHWFMPIGFQPRIPLLTVSIRLTRNVTEVVQ